MSPPVVLWQSPAATGRAAADTRAQAEVAAALGCRVVELPEDLEDEASVHAFFDRVEPAQRAVTGVWVGFFPTPAVYAAVFDACAAKGIELIHTPAQHLDALTMERATARLGELTPRTVVIDGDTMSEAKLDDAVRAVGGYPVFVKGAIKSRKEEGWSACVAEDAAALYRIARATLAMPEVIARGQVIVRALAPLKRREVGDRDFLVAKEFRVFLHEAEPLAWSFYWPYLLDEYWPLPAEEEREMLAVARAAAEALGVPYVTVDVAQREDEAWIVVEPSDAQFSGLNLVDPRALWTKLAPRLAR